MQTPQRLLSLDVLRGLTVIGMIVVNGTAGVYYGLQYEVFPTLLHAQWAGFHLADAMFPGFLFMMGVSVPLSLGRVKASGTRGSALPHIGARTLRIIALGLLVSNLWWLADLEGNTFRPMGVLQRIGLVYGLCAVTYLWCGWRSLLGLAVGLLVLYWPLCLLPSLDGQSTDIWTRGHNFVASVDRVVLGAHNYVKGPEGYDPEGILGTIPAYAHGLIGVLTGLYVRDHGRGLGLKLMAAGTVMAALGVAWGFVFPVVKDIWSSPFVLLSCGVMLAGLGGLHTLIDEHRLVPGWVTAFAVAFGINAIAAYMFHELSSQILTGAIFRLSHDAALAYVGAKVAALVPVVIYLLMIWLPLDYLRRRSWIIKA